MLPPDDLDLGATVRGFAAGQKLFNRYTLVRQLGRGGMGVVWLARDEELGRESALKFLPEVVAADRAAIEDMKREVRRAIDLAHPHIVKIHDFVTDGRTAAVSMGYVAGDTLSSLRIDQPGHVFSPESLASWLVQLCSALDYAHTKAKVVHRDLKPANLMIDATGDLKVLDFGIAASLSDSVSRVSVQAGSSGTPVYMSPQQMMGEKPAVTDDVYAVGATLYELLTGKPPFYSGNVILQVQNKLPPAMAARREELGVTGAAAIPRAWEETVARCLAKNPKDRPQSAGEIAERLGLAREMGQGARSREQDRQPTRLTEPAVAASSSPRTKSRAGLFAVLAAAAVALGGTGYYFGVHLPEQKRLAEARAKAEAEAVRIAALRGGVIVRTTPAGAEVTVGSLEHGRSPLTIKEAKLGTYPVKVRLDGYEEWSGSVEVKENAFAEVDAPLVRSTGGARIESEPSGLPFVLTSREKTERGITPATLKELPTGEYALTVQREGWPEEKQRVTVRRGETAGLEARFSGGTLELTSTPAGAEVWADGEMIGKTPLRYEDVPPRSYAYEYRLNGYKAAKVEGRIEAGKAAREVVTLEELPFPKPGQGWENTLGMKFVPVPGTGVLFSVWETREEDYAQFTRATGRSWQSANAGGKHPAVNVSWVDARAFCRWLTEKERKEGRLGADQGYRLPQDWEWSVAVGLDEPRSGSPEDKDGKITGVYPWGTQWPPPRGAGNFADETAKRSHRFQATIAGYDDGHAGTAPVGGFSANRHGLHDLSGNVWEWCEDYNDGNSGARALRGGSFGDNDARSLLSSFRVGIAPGNRSDFIGFRCVVVVGGFER